MKSAFEVYYNLWPESRLDVLKLILKDVFVIKIPSQISQLSQSVPKKTIIVIEDDNYKFNPINFLRHGFDHIIFQQRKDFTAELLASCMMIYRPKTFTGNPVPFFFNGFSPVASDMLDPNLVFDFSQSSEKQTLLDALNDFLDQDQSTYNIKELCIQSADEMITNAIFNAPINSNGQRINSGLERNTDVKMPGGKKGRFFASASGHRAIVGCEDPFGSLQRQTVLERLEEIYNHTQVSPKGGTGGTGLGLKYMIDNSSNFYLYCDYGKKTVIACAFLLKGMKANTSPNKHFHISTG